VGRCGKSCGSGAARNRGEAPSTLSRALVNSQVRNSRLTDAKATGLGHLEDRVKPISFARVFAESFSKLRQVSMGKLRANRFDHIANLRSPPTGITGSQPHHYPAGSGRGAEPSAWSRVRNHDVATRAPRSGNSLAQRHNAAQVADRVGSGTSARPALPNEAMMDLQGHSSDRLRSRGALCQ